MGLRCLGVAEMDGQACVESRLAFGVLSEVKSEASEPPIMTGNNTRR